LSPFCIKFQTPINHPKWANNPWVWTNVDSFNSKFTCM